MKSTFKKVAASLLLVPAMVLGIGFVATPNVSAATDCDPGTAGLNTECIPQGQGQRSDLFGTDGVVTNIINTMLFIIGILAVIMLIFGGIRYVTSSGDAGRVTAAKNTVMYAIIGLIVAIVAWAVVNWVMSTLGDNQ